MGILIAILITYVAVTLFGHVVHWSLHQPWTGKFNKSHMTHHLTLYPPSDYTSDKYRSAGKDNTAITFALASIPVVGFPILLGVLGFISWPVAIAVVLVEVGLGLLHDYIHDTFHIKNHWMSRVPLFKVIFKVWVELHYIHHVDMNKNYGIFTFVWDKIFGTYRRY